MRVLILADGLFATRERALLSRLEVGLADEGVRVVQATPEDVPASAAGLAGAATDPAGFLEIRHERYAPKLFSRAFQVGKKKDWRYPFSERLKTDRRLLEYPLELRLSRHQHPKLSLSSPE